MVVLDKKKIIMVIFITIISIISMLFLIFFDKKIETKTVSWQINGKTIVIDAGHGFPDERCSTDKME